MKQIVLIDDNGVETLRQVQAWPNPWSSDAPPHVICRGVLWARTEEWANTKAGRAQIYVRVPDVTVE